MATAYLCIGSNVGDKRSNCEEAVRRLQAAGDIKVRARSGLYRTEPVGGPPQEEYLNGALGIETTLSPGDLLRVLKDIEKDMGRRETKKNHPRIIDIDILFYDDLVMNSEGLTIPHPRVHERYFALKGLAEIAPFASHPVVGKTVSELYEEVGEQKTEDRKQKTETK